MTSAVSQVVDELAEHSVAIVRTQTTVAGHEGRLRQLERRRGVDWRVWVPLLVAVCAAGGVVVGHAIDLLGQGHREQAIEAARQEISGMRPELTALRQEIQSLRRELREDRRDLEQKIASRPMQ